ncbi:MAG TPA: hypothetical protein GYA07_07735 [Verrucomicrobia bacterium]|nr:hypothetical protein [Verrucomicrobiota bacterium]HOB33163.1 hypothetical protein [Verrucomicrobiota bacterium]HOP99048.1 hypothetical protein [Verrucomicrobiota bacterium]HPU55548.1 hypothetical protein [Verrucomicrobiota bacterium]
MRNDTWIRLGALSTGVLAALAAGYLSLARAGAGQPNAARSELETGVKAQGADFRVQLENHPPPHAAQVKTLLRGATAEQQSGGLILVTDAALEDFGTNGTLKMQAYSPVCVFDVMQRTISSTGLLQIRTADDRLFIQGEGFLLRTNTDGSLSHLTVSNRVHTVIRDIRGNSPRL